MAKLDILTVVTATALTITVIRFLALADLPRALTALFGSLVLAVDVTTLWRIWLAATWPR